MAIEETFRSKNYDPEKIDGRYVQFGADGKFRWIECATFPGVGRLDVRQGICRPADLPTEIMDKALDRRAAGVWPFYVDWPR